MQTGNRNDLLPGDLQAAALFDAAAGTFRWKSESFEKELNAPAEGHPMDASEHPVRSLIGLVCDTRQTSEKIATVGKDNGIPAQPRRWVVSPIENATGHVDALVQCYAMPRDGAGRLSLSQADLLRASEYRYRSVLESLPVAVYTCDADGFVTLFNDVAVDLWGRAPEIGKDQWCGSWRIFRTDGTPMPLEECPMAVALREGKRVRGVEIVVERPDGTRRNVLPHPDPIFDESGRVVGAINMLVDITQRKRDEQALLHANRELRRRNDEMAQFIYTVSHDLKAPLVTTMGCVGMIREDLAAGRKPSIEVSIGHIERAMSHMNELIDDLLRLGRTGRAELAVDHVDLAEVAAELAKQFEKRLADAHVTLHVQSPLPCVAADRRALMQALESLLANAIVHGRRPSMKVTLGAVEIDDEVRVFVQDDGAGIASQYHKKIFGLFQRLDNKREGTGVGLAIVSRIMELHGGRAWVESMPDHGATFWLAFPRCPVNGSGRESN